MPKPTKNLPQYSSCKATYTKDRVIYPCDNLILAGLEQEYCDECEGKMMEREVNFWKTYNNWEGINMKQSNWMKGLLWAEEEKNQLLKFGLSKEDTIRSLKSDIAVEDMELLCCEDWIDGARDYVKHYEGEL